MLKRFPLFALGSAMGAFVDYVVTLSAISFLYLNPAVALALAMAISGSGVFFFHVHVTFQYSAVKSFQQYVLFVAWTCLIFFLRAIFVQACLHIGLHLAVALIVAIGFVSIINFVISSVIISAKPSS